jgi:hypothetical protein
MFACYATTCHELWWNDIWGVLFLFVPSWFVHSTHSVLFDVDVYLVVIVVVHTKLLVQFKNITLCLQTNIVMVQNMNKVQTGVHVNHLLLHVFICMFRLWCRCTSCTEFWLIGLGISRVDACMHWLSVSSPIHWLLVGCLIRSVIVACNLT